MIRKWLKNIVREVLLESFPACNISVMDSDKSNIKLFIEGGNFVDSTIRMDKIDPKDSVSITHCRIENTNESFESFIKVNYDEGK